MARGGDQTAQIYIKYKHFTLFHDLSTLSENEDLNLVIFFDKKRPQLNYLQVIPLSRYRYRVLTT